MKKIAIIAVNSVLVLVIVGLITATWMPAIYTSQWFQRSPWVQKHFLHGGGSSAGSGSKSNDRQGR